MSLFAVSENLRRASQAQNSQSWIRNLQSSISSILVYRKGDWKINLKIFKLIWHGRMVKST